MRRHGDGVVGENIAVVEVVVIHKPDKFLNCG